MASAFAPSKRPYERNPLEPNGRGKRKKPAHPNMPQNLWKVLPGSIIFRVLCPSSKFGSIIGKGGNIVAKIRQETGAKIRIEESVPGCEERVVVITGWSEKDAEVSKETTKENNEETDVENIEEKEDPSALEDLKSEKRTLSENIEEKEDSSTSEHAKSEKRTSSAQKALLLVYERLIEGEPSEVNGDGENPISVRLLILSSQVGCLLGKGGSVIKQMSGDSGAHIRILPKDSLPSCTSPIDEIVQITGGIDSVRKALQSISQHLLENPPRDRDSFPATIPSGPSSYPLPPFPRPEVLPHANYPEVIPPGIHHLPVQRPPFPDGPNNLPDYNSPIPPSFIKFHEGAAPGPIQVPPGSIVYRLLCSNDKAGSVIGKGGSIIKTLQHETGCVIKVHETVPESEDRIVVISGPVLPGDGISPPQDAVLRVHDRIMMALPGTNESSSRHDRSMMAVPGTNESSSRLLVSNTQTGCLIGKGGAIIAEMRKRSGAQIRILSKDKIPKGVAENDEVVQITGELGAVKDALLQITATLRHHLFRDKIPRTAHPHGDQIPPFGPRMGWREPSPPRLYSNLTPFQNNSFGHPHEERSAFVPHAVEKLPPAPWPPQDMREGGDFMLQRRIGGFSGGNHPAVITNTSVDVVVPRALVPSIYGENGFCLRQIREISEAKITITEPRPEATETVIIISGTPEQTHAAQSLLQAFVLSESGPP